MCFRMGRSLLGCGIASIALLWGLRSSDRGFWAYWGRGREADFSTTAASAPPPVEMKSFWGERQAPPGRNDIGLLDTSCDSVAGLESGRGVRVRFEARVRNPTPRPLLFGYP